MKERPIPMAVMNLLVEKSRDEKIDESLLLRRIDSIMDSIICWFSDPTHGHEDVMIVMRGVLLYCNTLFDMYPNLSAEEIRTWIEING